MYVGRVKREVHLIVTRLHVAHANALLEAWAEAAARGETNLRNSSQGIALDIESQAPIAESSPAVLDAAAEFEHAAL